MIHPLRGLGMTTQTFSEHVARAKANGWCYQPGPCPGGVKYFGGWDLGVPMNTEAVAALAAEVSKVSWDAGYGFNVQLVSGEYLVIYAHLSGFKVKVGDLVMAGDVIGYTGNSGNSTGPHLHFEVRKSNIPIDPVPLMGRSSEVGQDEQENGEPAFYGRIPAAPLMPAGELLYPIKVRYGPGQEAMWTNAYIEKGAVVHFTRFQVVRERELWGCIGGFPEEWIAIYHNDQWLVRLGS